MSTQPTTVAAPLAPFRQTLVSVQSNSDVGDWAISSDAIAQGSPKFSVTKRRLHGGRQEGAELIRVDNGRMAITVIPTRGMGILNVESPALALGWKSPVKEVVHPQFVNLPSRGGLGWLEGFNEWLVRCGLEFAGGPGKDAFITNTGAAAEMDLTLHGRIANTPASEVELIVDRVPPYTIRLRGRVSEAMFYGPKLELWSELQIEPNAMKFRVHDTVTNRGACDQEFEVIYHINYGHPLLEAGSHFNGPIARVTPMNAHAALSCAEYARYAAPVPGFVEQVYCMRALPGPDGRIVMLLRNAAGTLASSIRYPAHQLPCFTLWKCSGALADGYVTGLEPGTNFPHNRRVERQAGRLGKLAPGQSREFVLDFALHTTQADVQAVEEEIRAVQAGCPTQLDSEPEKTN